jgi:hypothetical protein
LFERYDSAKHGFFDPRGRSTSAGYAFEGVEDSDLLSDGALDRDEPLATEDGPLEDVASFALEAHLEEFIASNWSAITFGAKLELYRSQAGDTGRQFRTDVGVIDFLCTDQTDGALVVIELKRGRPADSVVGQCQRYMGWVKAHLAKEGQQVRGMIVAREPDERLRYALLAAPNLSLRCYEVSFKLTDPYADSIKPAKSPFSLGWKPRGTN